MVNRERAVDYLNSLDKVISYLWTKNVTEIEYEIRENSKRTI